MGVNEWTGIAAVAITVILAIIAGIAHAVRTSYRFGLKDQEMIHLKERVQAVELSAEQRANDHTSTTTALSLLNQSIEGVKSMVDELRHDVKNLLTGKVQLARRANSRSTDQ